MIATTHYNDAKVLAEVSEQVKGSMKGLGGFGDSRKAICCKRAAGKPFEHATAASLQAPRTYKCFFIKGACECALRISGPGTRNCAACRGQRITHVCDADHCTGLVRTLTLKGSERRFIG